MKKGIVTFCIGLLVSAVFGFSFNQLQPSSTQTVYYLQVGVYETYDNALKMKDCVNKGHMYQNNQLYYVICGITTQLEALESTKQILIDENINYIQKEIVIEKSTNIEETLLEALKT